MTKSKTRRHGGALKFSEYRGGANMDLEKDEMVGGKFRRRGGAPLQDNKLGDRMKGGSKRRRKTVKRGGSSLGGMFGGMDSFTDTVNSMLGTKF